MEPLTKSYVNTCDPEHPVRDLTFYQVFEEARDRGSVCEIVNLETGTSMLSPDIFKKADCYAKGLLAIGYVPGKDTIVVIGESSLEPIPLFVAACSIGISFAKPFIYTPKETCIVNILEALGAKVVVVGESGNGDTFAALVSLFEDGDSLKSTVLPELKHIFYDNSYKDRSPQQKYLLTLDKLIELGKDISDEQLEAAKKKVTPDTELAHVFTSGSTGKPKCITHINRGLANDILVIPVDNLGPAMCVNPCLDEFVSFAMVSLTLADKFSKLFLSMEIGPGNMEEATRALAEVLIKEGIETTLMGGKLTQLIANHVKECGAKAPLLKYVGYGGQVVARQFKENIKSVFGEKHYISW